MYSAIVDQFPSLPYTGKGVLQRLSIGLTLIEKKKKNVEDT